MAGHWCLPQCPGSTSVTAPMWNRPTSRASPLVNGLRSCQLIIKHDLTHRFHIRTLGVRPSVRFYIGEGTVVEPAHFWSQGPLVNGVRSWQLIINHDLKHPFHIRALGIRPRVLVPHR